MKVKHPPIKNYKHAAYPDGNVTQYFGENPELYKQALNMNGHNGLDIVAPWGTPLYAVEDGLVVEVKDSPDGYGKHLRFLSDESMSEWTYGHNSENLVKVGDKIKAGDHIANMGNTGFVVSGYTPFWSFNPFAGTHLHLGRRIFKYDRRGWRYNKGTPFISIENYQNGYFGGVDFSRMLGGWTRGEIIATPDSVISFINWLRSLGLLK